MINNDKQANAHHSCLLFSLSLPSLSRAALVHFRLRLTPVLLSLSLPPPRVRVRVRVRGYRCRCPPPFLAESLAEDLLEPSSPARTPLSALLARPPPAPPAAGEAGGARMLRPRLPSGLTLPLRTRLSNLSLSFLSFRSQGLVGWLRVGYELVMSKYALVMLYPLSKVEPFTIMPKLTLSKKAYLFQPLDLTLTLTLTPLAVPSPAARPRAPLPRAAARPSRPGFVWVGGRVWGYVYKWKRKGRRLGYYIYVGVGI